MNRTFFDFAARQWPGRLVLMAGAAALVMSGCAQSAPDEAAPQTVPTNTDPQVNTNKDPGKTTATDDGPQSYKPNVDPRTGEMDKGTQVGLRPKEEPKVDPDPVEPKPEEPKPIDGKLGGGVDVDLTPQEEAPSRARRRMNIDQLNMAVRRVSGGIAWTAGKGISGKSAGSDNFVVLARTLGKPNYTDLTSEDLSPGALFQKFLGDAASSVCKKMIERDGKEKTATKRILLRHVGHADTVTSNPMGVNKNLSALLLRFHGRNLAPSSKQLETWRFLFQSATKLSKSPLMGWRAVCVGLIQHPRFYTY